jgi:opacity protein-like surface antigen
MRSRLLATTAVLLATIAIAAAQSNPQGGASQSPTSPGASGGARGQEGGAGQAQDRGQGQDKGGGRKYFVYQDEIIIVDEDMRIVAVLTV